MAYATSAMVTDLVLASPSGGSVVLQDAYRARLDELAGERDRRAGEAFSAQSRFKVAMEQIGRQQTAILESVEERRDLASALDVIRARLRDAVEQRDNAQRAGTQLQARLEAADAAAPRADLDGADLADTLEAVSGVLSETVAERDAATAESAELAHQLADLEVQVALDARRQDEMMDQLEQAVALSFGPLEEMFEKTNLDVAGLIESVRRTHSGQGGPLGAPSVSSKSYDDAGLGARFDKLMLGLDRVNLMRVAAGKVPYAMPVHSSFRFTSGFGTRRDP
jgi:DNA-binding protein H-NS